MLKVVYLIAILTMILMVGFLAYVGISTDAVTNPKLVNTVTFAMALISLPGTLVMLLDVFGDTSKKKEEVSTLEGQCPRCYEKTTYYMKSKTYENG
ncbi:hypothetical protein [Halobacillus sp. BAB-2008]|uniref:hypothetical protein n=1 Tax=Halobacillus sp. BAB-2008 TaxID=1246484 RepID=UPI0002A4F1DD|nr:hypothetical protein [Halobacillus sp. BAB-2008]ELK47201.1 hypothetical protein D479_07107 [Halobacillus sp. BAB-2008]